MRDYDVRRTLGSLYAPDKEPTLVQVPQQLFCIVDGEGKAEEESYELAVQLLFAMSNTLHAQFGRHRLYQSFTISPLECLWSPLEVENRQTWRWSAMNAQPEWLSEELFFRCAIRLPSSKACIQVRLTSVYWRRACVSPRCIQVPTRMKVQPWKGCKYSAMNTT